MHSLDSLCKRVMTSVSSEHLLKRQYLMSQFAEAIEDYQRGAINSRGLAHRADEISTAEDIAPLEDELLNHTFWAMHHLLHQPACWAAKPEEISYLGRCLRGEETFDQTIVDEFRA